MKGIVLGYSAEAEAIVVRADDGRRYRFQAGDWRERAAPRKGDAVDFEPEGERARDVYRLESNRPVEKETPAAPLAIVSGWAPARFFLLRPVFSFALLVLIACFFGTYGVGDARISLYQVPDLIRYMTDALDSLIAVSGTDPAPRLGAAVVHILLVFLLALYAVPVLAGLTAWREFVGRPSRRLARWAGIAAIVLPIGLPLLIAIVVQAWVLPGIPDAGARLGRAGVTTPQQVFEVLRLYATGTVVLVFTGAGLWASATGRFSVPLGTRTADEPPLEVKRERKTSPLDIFAPLRKRRDPARTPAARPTAPEPTASSRQAPPPPMHSGPVAEMQPMADRPHPAPQPPQPPQPAQPHQPRQSEPRTPEPAAARYQSPEPERPAAVNPPVSPGDVPDFVKLDSRRPPAPAQSGPVSAPPVSAPPVSAPPVSAPPASVAGPADIPAAASPEPRPAQPVRATEPVVDDRDGTGDFDTGALADDIKTVLESNQTGPAPEPEAEADLPPRGGSVWPEPAGLVGRPPAEGAPESPGGAAASDQPAPKR